MVGQPVDQCAGEPLGAQNRGPILEGQIRGDDGRAAPRSPTVDLEQVRKAFRTARFVHSGAVPDVDLLFSVLGYEDDGEAADSKSSLLCILLRESLEMLSAEQRRTFMTKEAVRTILGSAIGNAVLALREAAPSDGTTPPGLS